MIVDKIGKWCYNCVDIVRIIVLCKNVIIKEIKMKKKIIADNQVVKDLNYYNSKVESNTSRSYADVDTAKYKKDALI